MTHYYAPSFPMSMRTLPPSTTEDAIVQQVDWYMGRPNLQNDEYLKRQMDDDLWVSLDVILAFPKMKRIGVTDKHRVASLLQVRSSVVEVDEHNGRIRPAWARRSNIVLHDVPMNTRMDQVIALFHIPITTHSGVVDSSSSSSSLTAGVGPIPGLVAIHQLSDTSWIAMFDSPMGAQSALPLVGDKHINGQQIVAEIVMDGLRPNVAPEYFRAQHPSQHFQLSQQQSQQQQHQLQHPYQHHQQPHQQQLSHILPHPSQQHPSHAFLPSVSRSTVQGSSPQDAIHVSTPAFVHSVPPMLSSPMMSPMPMPMPMLHPHHPHAPPPDMHNPFQAAYNPGGAPPLPPPGPPGPSYVPQSYTAQNVSVPRSFMGARPMPAGPAYLVPYQTPHFDHAAAAATAAAHASMQPPQLPAPPLVASLAHPQASHTPSQTFATVVPSPSRAMPHSAVAPDLTGGGGGGGSDSIVLSATVGTAGTDITNIAVESGPDADTEKLHEMGVNKGQEHSQHQQMQQPHSTIDSTPSDAGTASESASGRVVNGTVDDRHIADNHSKGHGFPNNKSEKSPNQRRVEPRYSGPRGNNNNSVPSSPTPGGVGNSGGGFNRNHSNASTGGSNHSHGGHNASHGSHHGRHHYHHHGSGNYANNMYGGREQRYSSRNNGEGNMRYSHNSHHHHNHHGSYGVHNNSHGHHNNSGGRGSGSSLDNNGRGFSHNGGPGSGSHRKGKKGGRGQHLRQPHSNQDHRHSDSRARNEQREARADNTAVHAVHDVEQKCDDKRPSNVAPSRRNMNSNKVEPNLGAMNFPPLPPSDVGSGRVVKRSDDTEAGLIKEEGPAPQTAPKSPDAGSTIISTNERDVSANAQSGKDREAHGSMDKPLAAKIMPDNKNALRDGDKQNDESSGSGGSNNGNGMSYAAILRSKKNPTQAQRPSGGSGGRGPRTSGNMDSNGSLKEKQLPKSIENETEGSSVNNSNVGESKNHSSFVCNDGGESAGPFEMGRSRIDKALNICESVDSVITSTNEEKPEKNDNPEEPKNEGRKISSDGAFKDSSKNVLAKGTSSKAFTKKNVAVETRCEGSTKVRNGNEGARSTSVWANKPKSVFEAASSVSSSSPTSSRNGSGSPGGGVVTKGEVADITEGKGSESDEVAITVAKALSCSNGISPAGGIETDDVVSSGTSELFENAKGQVRERVHGGGGGNVSSARGAWATRGHRHWRKNAGAEQSSRGVSVGGETPNGRG